MRYDPNGKRLFDVLTSGIGLFLSLPIQLGVGVVVRANLGSPVIFKQERPGKDGEIFTLYKFRTMREPDPERGLVSNEDRITPFGKALRATSLDELPELWNVLKGDMSLVGPRPLRTFYMDLYSPRQHLRHSVRPGLTGLAQVSGRNSLTWDERFELDLKYARNITFSQDLQIMLKTITTVLKRNDITDSKNATMSAFTGPTYSVDQYSLRRLRECDLQTRVDWMRDERVSQGITLNYEPTIEGMRKWFEGIQKNASRRDFVIVDGADEVVAMVGFTGICDFGAKLYIFVDPNRQGSGLGTIAMRILEKYGYHQLWDHLKLETKVGNSRQVNFYQRLGYVVEGERNDKILMRKQLPA
ncbi:MAG: GNAT family N-acetyltransferase [Actinomycetaceae bacterium]|nr:GNAT family N-acetyltransferase [Actinomycetaceae bacterium]